MFENHNKKSHFTTLQRAKQKVQSKNIWIFALPKTDFTVGMEDLNGTFLVTFKHCGWDEGVGVMASTWLHYFKGRTQDSTSFLEGKKVEGDSEEHHLERKKDLHTIWK